MSHPGRRGRPRSQQGPGTSDDRVDDPLEWGMPDRQPSEPAEREPHGIVIHHGSSRPATVAVWAYLWSADDDAAPHWHELVPAERGLLAVRTAAG